MAEKPNFISLLQINNGSIGKIHDSSAIHDIVPSSGINASTWVVTHGNPLSDLTTTSILYLPAGVALKSDILAVMIYKDTVSQASELPARGDASIGWVYVASAAFNYSDTSIEAGDMFIYNGKPEPADPWDIVQTNIDPARYATKDHTHSVTVSGNTDNTKITPTGTISVTVSGASTTFNGEYTPAGSVTVGNFGFTDTNASVTNNLSISDHSHTFTGTAATISITISKAADKTGSTSADVTGSITASYTPAGSVSTTLTTSSTEISVTGTFAEHSHSFTGSLSTFTGNYKPTGTISAPVISATVSTGSFMNVNGVSLSSGSVNVPIQTTTTSVISTLSATIDNSNELLNLNWSTGDVVTGATATISTGKVITNVTLTSASVTYASGVNATVSAPTFYGTETQVSVSGTPNGKTGDQGGSISASSSYVEVTAVGSSFTGTAATISPTFTLSAASHSHSIANSSVASSTEYTPAGTISSKTLAISGDITVSYKKTSSALGTFTGTKATVSVTGTPLLNAPTGTFYGAEITHSHSITNISASVSKPVEP